MFRNYFLVTIRNLLKNRIYSVINILGLAIGITCSLLIMLWVVDETSYDQFHTKADRLYQVWINAEFDGKINSWNSVPQPTAEAMKTADSHITNSVVTDWGGEHLLNVDENPIRKDGFYAGEEFLEMFDFPLLQGDPATVLDEPASIVISESTARALFGNEDAMNKTIRIDDAHDLKVTGILKDVPKTSSFDFDFLVPWKFKIQTQEWVKRDVDNWGNYSYQAFVELADASDEATVEKSILNMLDEHGENDFKSVFFLHPLLRWRLHSNFENGVESGGMADYVNLFSIIAIFIILIACINFMNLATARSERRAKEVGIRKSIGSNRWELVLQFIGESVFISLIAFVLALLLSLAVLPFYNDLVDKELSLPLTSGLFWSVGLGMILIIGLVSGSYPAFYLSSFQPVKVLKGKVQIGNSGSTPRKVLVTLQFGFSILLIIGTIVIFNQIELVKNRELGYNQENLITVNMNTELSKNYDPLKLELLKSGLAESVTISNSAITSINSNNFVGWPGKPDELRVIFTTIATEYDYTETMGIKVLDGRDFSKDFPTDTSAIIINKAGLDIMGLDDPIGTQLDLWGKKRTLIGIVEDVMMGSPFQPVKPMFMIIDRDWSNALTIRLKKSNNLQATLNEVKTYFEKYNPAYPFEYTFVDEEFQKKFETINMTSSLANLFAILTIVITGLGLFGLAAFMAEKRTKEIGIRKVLGASVISIVSLMSKDFSKLVIFAFLVAAPVGWWLLNLYLERYPIRTEVHWWIFPVTGIIALVFALVVVATQSLRAAHSNPVKALRSE